MNELSAEQDEREVLEYLVEYENLSGAALGVARQVIDRGRDSMSDGQLQVWDWYIAPYLKMKCRMCGSPLPASEILPALVEEDGHCCPCRNMLGRDD